MPACTRRSRRACPSTDVRPCGGLRGLLPVDPDTVDVGAHRRRPRRASGRATALASAARRRGADGVPGHRVGARPPQVVSPARDRASVPRTRSASSRSRPGTRVDVHGRHRPTRWIRLVGPFAGGALEKYRQGCRGRDARVLDDRAKAAGDGVAIVGSGRAACPRPGPSTAMATGRPLRARARPAATSPPSRWTRRAASSTSTRVHRCNERDLSASGQPVRGARGRDAAEARCRSRRSAGPATSSSGLAVCAGSSAQRGLAAVRLPADVPRYPRFYRDAPGDPRRPRPTGMTLGEYLADRQLRRLVPRPLPRPDHRGRLVDGARTHPRVPGRLPAPVPRQSRPHRPRQRASVADRDRRVRAYVRRVSSRCCRKGPCAP